MLWQNNGLRFEARRDKSHLRRRDHMELWFTEEHSENVKFSVKVDEHLYSEQSKYQRIDIMKSYEFVTFLH